MTEYFTFRESSNGWMIVPVYEKLGAPSIIGSFNVLPCRFMGLSWGDWLRLCAQNGATLHGKNCIWVRAVWREKNNEFLRQLNQRVNEIAKVIDLKELNY